MMFTMPTKAILWMLLTFSGLSFAFIETDALGKAFLSSASITDLNVGSINSVPFDNVVTKDSSIKTAHVTSNETISLSTDWTPVLKAPIHSYQPGNILAMAHVCFIMAAGSSASCRFTNPDSAAAFVTLQSAATSDQARCMHFSESKYAASATFAVECQLTTGTVSHGGALSGMPVVSTLTLIQSSKGQLSTRGTLPEYTPPSLTETTGEFHNNIRIPETTLEAVVDDDTTAIVLYDFYSELVGATWITPKATINFDASSQYMMHFQYTPKTSMTLFDVDQVSAGQDVTGALMTGNGKMTCSVVVQKASLLTFPSSAVENIQKLETNTQVNTAAGSESEVFNVPLTLTSSKNFIILLDVGYRCGEVWLPVTLRLKSGGKTIFATTQGCGQVSEDSRFGVSWTGELASGVSDLIVTAEGQSAIFGAAPAENLWSRFMTIIELK